MPFISSIRKQYDNISKTNILDHLEITGGDEIYTAGGYRIHLFTKTGNSEFKIIPKATNNTSSEYQHLITNGAVEVDYLIVAGGGGGATNLAGGGGAGGYLEGKAVLAVGATAPTSVGAGAGPNAPGSRYAVGGNGSPSVFNAITATGGGGGGAYSGGTGLAGGSGGGGGGGSSHHAGGGGGGAGAAGRNATQPSTTDGGQYGAGTIGQGHPGGRGGGHIHTAGQGGSGLSSTITGTSVMRGGGGGGSGYPSSPGADRGHPGGAGGGGTGRQTDIQLAGETGATNTGGGGGSGSHFGFHGGGGGPGIIVVRYRV